ncbi:unannotated protein [freshwater metagenome]|uniref:Unannotated protein n=1 Tax=freshwater metagenome TaxID=449393 RepID=A0A6J6J0M2_9ZZZZ
MVVFSAVEFGDEIMCRSHVGDDGVLEATDTSFERVSTVEKHDVVSALGNEVVHLSRAEVLSTVEDTGFTDDDFFGRRERDEFGACLDAEAGEIVTRAL